MVRRSYPGARGRALSARANLGGGDWRATRLASRAAPRLRFWRGFLDRQGGARHRREPRHRRGRRPHARARGRRRSSAARAPRTTGSTRSRARSTARSPRSEAAGGAGDRGAGEPGEGRGLRARGRGGARDAYGPVDILINNAAVAFFGPTVDLPVSRWLASWRVTVHATFLLSKLVLPDDDRARLGADRQRHLGVGDRARRRPLSRARRSSATPRTARRRRRSSASARGSRRRSTRAGSASRRSRRR